MSPLTYLKLALAAALLIGGFVSGWKVEGWRWGASETAAVTAAINNVNAENAKALARLNAEHDAATKAALADQANQAVITKTVVQWKEKVVAVPVPAGPCRVLDARDDATVTGLRAILAAADPNPSPAGATTPGADGGHPAARPAGPDHDAGSTGPSNPGPGGVGSGAAVAPQGSPGLGGKLKQLIEQ